MKNMLKANYHKTPKYFKTMTIIGTLFMCCHSMALAQSEDKDGLSKVNLYVDIGALPIGQASINIERRFYSGDKITWYGRAGFGAMSTISDDGFGGLGAITMLTGKNKNHFELNGGVAVGFSSSRETVVWPVLDLGYRFQKPDGGFIFRAKAGSLGIGIGLGYAF